jgi:4-amino-4-deoxy-L-arabinose transferase-like glycosyltransferase
MATKLTDANVQSAVWQIELGRGKRVIQWLAIVLVAVVLALWYAASEFRGLRSREAMDMAQLARNISQGKGFTTDVIRPFSLWHMKNYAPDRLPRLMDHPDIYNPPLYPLALAGIFKILPEAMLGFDSTGRIYLPERWVILPFNQLCLLLTLLMVYLWAKRVFDKRVAVTAAVILLLSDTLWAYSISGLPTVFLMLLLMIALYLAYRADERLNPAATETAGSTEESAAAVKKMDGATAALLLASAVVMGLCFLTRHVSAFLMVPMVMYVGAITRGRAGKMWMLLYVAVFLAVIAPWLVRNYQVSGSVLGIARYDIRQGAAPFVGDVMHRSIKPDMEGQMNIRGIFGKLLRGVHGGLVQQTRSMSSDYLVFFFGVGLMYRFRRPQTVRLRGTIVGGILVAALVFGLIVLPSDGTGLSGSNLFVLFLPIIAVYGVAFFYLMLDRIAFSVRLTRALAVLTFVVINTLSLGHTLLPPSPAPFAYPPYLPPVIRSVAQHFETDELSVSDIPWAVAWIGQRKCVWLPLTFKEFYDIHDFEHKVAFVYLSPYMMDRRLQSELMKGEYKGWSSLIQGKVPSDFPLKAVAPLPPDNEQLLLADRVRWARGESSASEKNESK